MRCLDSDEDHFAASDSEGAISEEEDYVRNSRPSSTCHCPFGCCVRVPPLSRRRWNTPAFQPFPSGRRSLSFHRLPPSLAAHSSLRFRALQSPQVLRGQSNRGCVAVASRCSRAHRVTPSKDVIRVTRPHRLNPMAFRIRMTQTPSTRLPSCGATPASGAAPPSQLQSLWTVPTAAVS